MSTVTTVGREPARIDIDAVAGEPVDFTEPVLDANGDAQDLTGWTLTAQVRRDAASPVLYTFTAEVVAGGIRIYASAVDTALWADWLVPAARWTLWLTPPASEPYLFAAGWVRVNTH